MPDPYVRQTDPSEPVPTVAAEMEALTQRFRLLLIEAQQLGFNAVFALGSYDPLACITCARYGFIGDSFAVHGLLEEIIPRTRLFK